MAEFFARRAGSPGLAVFLNAGDPPLDQLADVVAMLDEQGVSCLELAVPFPNSVTDGPVIRRSADRALARGVGLDEVLGFVAGIRPRLRRLRLVLLADWSHTVRPIGEAAFLRRVASSGTDALLVHALPPVLRDSFRQAAADAGVPLVATCYVTSPDAVFDAAARADAYVYLVAAYGRSGTAPAAGYANLTAAVRRIRASTTVPIAVGFGIRTSSDVAAVAGTGADAVVVGSAAVAHVEGAAAQRRDVTTALREFIDELRGPQRSSQEALT